ncbi:MAG: type IV secretion protein IcmC [Gammaproteobacteria bacterium RIFCSPHIGHO2_12_FULL_41_15]|nr:MAG: type IV secretion protein IcmC [Gammaproteobacteria bacterium RIFCSPHIGHO2_12_FULL_41_15]
MDSTTLMQSLGYIGIIIQDVGVLMGLSLFMAGVFRLKRYGEMRTFMSHQMTIAGPLLMLVAGVMLLCLPLVLRTALLNIWSTSNPLHYGGSTAGYAQLIPPVIVFVRLIGVGAFIRGIVLLSRAGGEQSQHGTFSRATLHIIGGILCVHILGTLSVLREIFGFTGLNT